MPAVFAEEVFLRDLDDLRAIARDRDPNRPHRVVRKLRGLHDSVREHVVDKPRRGIALLQPSVSVLVEREVELETGSARHRPHHSNSRRKPRRLQQRRHGEHGANAEHEIPKGGPAEGTTEIGIGIGI